MPASRPDLDAIAPAPGWEQLPGRIAGGAAMLLGTTGTGKTHLALWLCQRLRDLGAAPALLCADVGQPVIGVPGAMALASRLHHPPETLWFVGDISPARNLLPVAVGAGMLAKRAERSGARSLVVDTTGLVAPPLGHLLKYHKAFATGVTHLIAIQQAGELEPLLALLDSSVRRVHRLSPAEAVGTRPPEDRRAYRQDAFRAHLAGGAVQRYSPAKLIDANWTTPGTGTELQAGTLLGLLDEQGYCLSLAVATGVTQDAVEVHTAWAEPERVARIQLGRLLLSPGGVELGRPSSLSPKHADTARRFT